MNRGAIAAIARKDMRGITSNFQVWFPMVLLPLLFTVVMPGAMMLVLSITGGQLGDGLDKVAELLDKIASPAVRETLSALPSVRHQIAYYAANYMVAPFFLLIALMVSTGVSAQSFAGEKERGTLESLLFAPIDLPSLFAGKVLAAFLPSMGLSLICFVLYGLTVNLTGWSMFGEIFFPALNWLPLMLLVIPMVSLCSILVSVFISARVATFQAAYQMSGMVVLPVVALLPGQLAGAVVLDTLTLSLIGLGLAVVALLLLKVLAGRLDRGALFEGQVK